MKKGTKLGLGAFTLLLGAVVLSGCTASFCDNKDMSHMLYAYDYGVTEYSDTAKEGFSLLTLDDADAQAKITTNIYVKTSFDNAYGIKAVNDAAKATNNSKSLVYATPSLSYWAEMDKLVLTDAIKAMVRDDSSFTVDSVKKITRGFKYEDNTPKGALDQFGYLKFYDTVNDGKTLWANWDSYDQKIRNDHHVSIDECPTSDYISLFKSTMNSYVQNNRSCLTTQTGDYGYYGPNQQPVEIEGKSWGSAFSKTNFLWLEGILVWPMGALTDVIAGGLLNGGVGSGWAQLIAILVITFIVRAIMLLVTWKQSATTAKMNDLQPQIAKIQAKYPNANTNNYEKQRQASEMADLYKKNKINPLSSLLTMFIQFPVFICVWAALQGSAVLSSGTFLNLNFSQSISSVLFNASEWDIANGGGALTALMLFLLMSIAQVFAMLIPQWIQKAKQKKVAKLGNNPSKKSNDNKMKWFTYIMCGMIIFMGFSLASGMGIYWFIGAIFSICQTLIMNKVTASKAKKHK